MSHETNAPEHAVAEEPHHGVGHVVPMWILIGVGGILMVLTLATVAVTRVDLGGQANFLVAMVIALVKATLVAAYFMHLRWDKPFNTVIFLVSISLVVLFITFTILDTGEYQRQLIPGYAPDIERAEAVR